MADWISIIVVTIVVIGGLLIFYKALKEPIDYVGFHLKRFMLWVKAQIQGLSQGDYKEVISYS